MRKAKAELIVRMREIKQEKLKPVPCAIKIKRCARARPFLRRLPVIRNTSSGTLTYTDTDQANFALLVVFIPCLMVNASRRKCGAESSQDTRMKSMNETRVKEYEARTDYFRWNGSEEWPPMCESRKVRESAGR